MNDKRISFASDNNSGVHPAIMKALAEANIGTVPSYAEDHYSKQATRLVAGLFGDKAVTFFALTGTGANILGLKPMLSSHHAIVHSHIAHIHTDETGAAEAFIGCKLRPVTTGENGKVTPELVRPLLKEKGNPHHNQPRVISIAQTTEWGTVYTPEEVRALAAFAHENGMYLHMDGARLANAAAALNMPVASFTTDAGVDVVSLGGTKNGLMIGEAVVFLNPDLAESFPYIRKQSMQLYSKMRFVAAQFIAYLTDDLWLKNARHANAMAKRLSEGIRNLPHVTLLRPTEANGVFARLSPEHSRALQETFYFYTIDETETYHDARLMLSFNTPAEHVDAFIAAVRALQ